MYIYFDKNQKKVWTLKPTPFEVALALIDKKNAEDIHSYHAHGLDFPKELLYSQRMSQKLLQFRPQASICLLYTSRCV